jgi:hypothetical protein
VIQVTSLKSSVACSSYWIHEYDSGRGERGCHLEG